MLAYLGEDNRPVALLPITTTVIPRPRDRYQYEIFDPATGTRTAVDTHIPDLASVAYMFYRPLPDQEVQAWDLIKFALSGRTKDLIVILLTGVAVSLLGMLTPIATGFLIDTAIPDASQGVLWQIGLGLIAAAFGAAMFRYSQGYATLRLQSFSDVTTQAAV